MLLTHKGVCSSKAAFPLAASETLIHLVLDQADWPMQPHLLLKEAARVQVRHVMLRRSPLLLLPHVLAGGVLLLSRGAVRVRCGCAGAGQRQGRHGRGVGNDGGRGVGGRGKHVRVGSVVQPPR